MQGFEVIFDREAESDLTSILEYIGEARGRPFATSFVDRIISYCEGLANAPHRGAKRDDIKSGLRTVGWRRTVTIAFEISESENRVVVLGIFYRGRDVLAAMQERRE